MRADPWVRPMTASLDAATMRLKRGRARARSAQDGIGPYAIQGGCSGRSASNSAMRAA